jgi:PAS domain S-box-containing protein
MSSSAPQIEARLREAVFSGGGEMGALMRTLDWSETPVGAVSSWPQSLKTAVRIILTSRYAMFVWWGRELVNLYNDPYRAFLGVKHPAALGKSAREVWAEIWDQIGPRTDAVLLHGESTYDEALLLLMERHGYLEETYFTFSYSPLPDDAGNVGGLFCAVTEETQRVIGERRLGLLREIAAAAAEARTPADVGRAASQSLSRAGRDLPFSMIYLLEDDGRTLRRAGEAGIAGDHPAAPDAASLDQETEAVWPFRQVMESGEAVLIENLGQRIADIPKGEWSHGPERAILAPIARQGQTRPAGILVAGLSPHRRFDEEFRGFVLLLANQIAGAVANAVDLIRRQRTEEELRRNEEEFRALANAMPQLVWMARPDGWIFWYNQRWYEYTGTTPEQMEGWGWQSVHDPAALPAVMERWKASIATGQPFEMTFPLRGTDGVLRPFLTRIVPIRDARGNVTRWFGTNTDVSVEVRIQQELQESEERLRSALAVSQRMAAIVESSDDAIISKDLQGTVTSWNPGAEKMFGYTAEEIIGKPITTIIPPELHDDERRILATIARGERIRHFETVRITKSGQRIEVSLTVSPVKGEDGRITGAAKIARDITEKKKTERALRVTERLASVGRLAATVAHEINNPLEALTNLVYLARRSADRKDVRRYLAGAEEELDRISHLTKQTLGFYRETRGASAMQVGSVVNSLISVFASRARNKAIEISLEIEQDPEIYAVPGEVRQLVANLLSNSMDAVGGGGRVRIRVSARREWKVERRAGVRLTVADSGPGIPAAIRQELFEPFFTTKKEVGTGLGLWVCQSIVEKHQGSIRVKSSTRPGGSWTAFSVFLPLSPWEAGMKEEDLRQAG